METKSKKAKFSYKITPQTLKQYEKMNVYFTIPRLVAYYEYNHGKITPAKRIMYYRNPTPRQYPIDLNAGFETYIRRKSSIRSQYIELLLKYEMKCNGECRDVEKTKVITRRGTLVHIMESYYNKQYDKLSIRVSRYNGNIYMVREELDDSLSELKPCNTHHIQLEKFLFTDSPDKPGKTNEPCDENIVLVGVHRSNFGKYDIIYSGEIQGIISQEKIKDFDDLVALNDCRFVFTKQMWKTIKNKDNKYLKYWLQSYLANVKDIYVGYKNKNGIIEEPIENITARNLPKNCFWKPSICMGLLYDFLQNVEKRMSTVNCLNTVYMFHYNPEEKIFSYEIFKGKTDKTFISEDYMKYYKNLSNM
ncbi:decapping nuclease DXO homolog [Lucilia sericata]|uniref:decapping nuclease DXO homolog n=1 Tax=Lucilia sericata TaxID=13632 RepID=UPI0018A845B2|nr:decapping nuclease DXO homolog [Lucilia sericata]XP_037816077.1 decapping nuclease DXO homolog [Lucilia sericata]XP_037816078.1 decapping nuclease DXO homolog [Lucilia sericata]XP_037816079.1 decapping nuclease DXO homolog [Lucilia sericata]XP_037816080.1 decapping nuclease DXO homolog [Lucilia sericata]XP_037816081.1 decapping nuclease DXO homolog [Lucilia sericata]